MSVLGTSHCRKTHQLPLCLKVLNANSALFLVVFYLSKECEYFCHLWCVGRFAQGGGHHVASQPGPPGAGLDLRTCQLADQQPQIADWIGYIFSPLQWVFSNDFVFLFFLFFYCLCCNYVKISNRSSWRTFLTCVGSHSQTDKAPLCVHIIQEIIYSVSVLVMACNALYYYCNFGYTSSKPCVIFSCLRQKNSVSGSVNPCFSIAQMCIISYNSVCEVHRGNVMF